jgi:hypothetical protein
LPGYNHAYQAAIYGDHGDDFVEKALTHSLLHPCDDISSVFVDHQMAW